MKSTKLIYHFPAQDWNHALPLGNGKIGAMLWGATNSERIDLNEESLWSGFPRDDVNYESLRNLKKVRQYLDCGDSFKAHQLTAGSMLGLNAECYQPLGSISITDEMEPLDISEFKRELDLENALSKIQYRMSRGIVERKCFISNPSNVLAYQWAVPQGVRTNFVIKLESPHPHVFEYTNNCMMLKGRLPTRIVDNYCGDHPRSVLYEANKGMKFYAGLNICAQNGKISFDPASGNILINNCNGFVLFFTALSDFSIQTRDIYPDEKKIIKKCTDVLKKSYQKGYEKLFEAHKKEYQRFYNHMEFFLGEHSEQDDMMTVDALCGDYSMNRNGAYLESLVFQYGRYLLISSSRPGTEPANLQGIWNPYIEPPWGSGYTININTQMNYWPAETCALPECHESLLNFIDILSIKGKRTANVNYGCRGWTAHHNSDLWGKTSPTSGDPSWAFWPFGGAWFARHYFEHYEFYPDKEFLFKKAWPVLSEAALFLLDWFTRDSDGKLRSLPSSSPENLFFDSQSNKCALGISSAMDLQIARDLWQNCLATAGILGIKNDCVKEIANALENLPWPKIDAQGCICEWDQDYLMPEPGHRHFSPLYGLYPAALYDDKPEYRNACRKTLEKRLQNGAGKTSWSAAWAALLFARLGEGENAYSMLRRLIGESLLPNLFSNHPPFQIDGNFGATAAMAEMLVQSHNGLIRFLPALPTAWKNGRVRGLRARGGLVVDLEWKDGLLKKTVLKSFFDNSIKCLYADKILEITLKKNIPFEFNF